MLTLHMLGFFPKILCQRTVLSSWAAPMSRQSDRDLHLLFEMRKINVTKPYLSSCSLMPRSPVWSCRSYPTVWADLIIGRDWKKTCHEGFIIHAGSQRKDICFQVFHTVHTELSGLVSSAVVDNVCHMGEYPTVAWMAKWDFLFWVVEHTNNLSEDSLLAI